jgi:hypothetical protein
MLVRLQKQKRPWMAVAINGAIWDAMSSRSGPLPYPAQRDLLQHGLIGADLGQGLGKTIGSKLKIDQANADKQIAQSKDLGAASHGRCFGTGNAGQGG